MVNTKSGKKAKGSKPLVIALPAITDCSLPFNEAASIPSRKETDIMEKAPLSAIKLVPSAKDKKGDVLNVRSNPLISDQRDMGFLPPSSGCSKSAEISQTGDFPPLHPDFDLGEKSCSEILEFLKSSSKASFHSTAPVEELDNSEVSTNLDLSPSNLSCGSPAMEAVQVNISGTKLKSHSVVPAASSVVPDALNVVPKCQVLHEVVGVVPSVGEQTPCDDDVGPVKYGEVVGVRDSFEQNLIDGNVEQVNYVEGVGVCDALVDSFEHQFVGKHAHVGNEVGVLDSNILGNYPPVTSKISNMKQSKISSYFPGLGGEKGVKTDGNNAAATSIVAAIKSPVRMDVTGLQLGPKRAASKAEISAQLQQQKTAAAGVNFAVKNAAVQCEKNDVPAPFYPSSLQRIEVALQQHNEQRYGVLGQKMGVFEGNNNAENTAIPAALKRPPSCSTSQQFPPVTIQPIQPSSGSKTRQKLGSDNANTNSESAADIPPRLKQSYAAALNLGQGNDKHSNSTCFFQPDNPQLGKICSLGEEKIVQFSCDELRKLEEPLKYSLVGKFSFGRPSLQVMRDLFSSFKIGKHRIQLLNQRHVLIELTSSDDFGFVWLKREVVIGGYHMRLFKWERNFDFKHESSITPVWVRLENLPLHLYDNSALFTICQLIGNPLKIDEPTRLKSLVGYARVCVEIDLLKDLGKSVKIRQVSDLLEVDIIYENLPSYCMHCKHIGHSVEQCYVKEPGFRKVRKRSQNIQHKGEQIGEKQPIGRGKNTWVQKKQTIRKEYRNVPSDNGKNDHQVVAQIDKGKEVLQNPSTINSSSTSCHYSLDVDLMKGNNHSNLFSSNKFDALGYLSDSEQELDSSHLPPLALSYYCETEHYCEDISPPPVGKPLDIVPFSPEGSRKLDLQDDHYRGRSVPSTPGKIQKDQLLAPIERRMTRSRARWKSP